MRLFLFGKFNFDRCLMLYEALMLMTNAIGILANNLDFSSIT